LSIEAFQSPSTGGVTGSRDSINFAAATQKI
jgi:hypothetical protein